MFKPIWVFAAFIIGVYSARAAELLSLPLAPDVRAAELKSFEVHAFHSVKEILIYKAVYNLFDVAGQEGENLEKDPTPPYINCDYKDPDLSAKTSAEWGIVNLRSRKLIHLVVARKPARQKSECTSEAEAKKSWALFEKHVKDLGLGVGSPLKLKRAAEVAPALTAEQLRGLPVLEHYLSLKPVQRKAIDGSWSDLNFAKKTEVDDFRKAGAKYQETAAGLLLVRHKGQPVWSYAFTENSGALSSYESFDLRGFLGDAQGFVTLVQLNAKPGAQFYGHPYDRVLLSGKIVLK